MTRTSQIDELQKFAGDAPASTLLEKGVMGAIAAVGCFAVIGVFGAPITVVLDRVFFLALSLACIAGFTIMAKWHGVLSPGPRGPIEP
jgi:hypothetical protein